MSILYEILCFVNKIYASCDYLVMNLLCNIVFFLFFLLACIFWSPSLFSQQIDKSLNIHSVLNIGFKEKNPMRSLRRMHSFMGQSNKKAIAFRTEIIGWEILHLAIVATFTL